MVVVTSHNLSTCIAFNAISYVLMLKLEHNIFVYALY